VADFEIVHQGENLHIDIDIFLTAEYDLSARETVDRVGG